MGFPWAFSAFSEVNDAVLNSIGWRVPYNVSLLEADSVDLRLTCQVSTVLGRFGITGDYSQLLNLETQNFAGGQTYDLLLATIWVLDFRSSFIGTFSHSYGDYAQTWTMAYRGGTAIWNQYSVLDGENMWGNPDTDSRVSPWVTWNWTGQYYFIDDLLARLRVFNQGPPKDETFNWFEDPWFKYYTYSGAAVGRQVYAEVEWTFGRD